MCAPAIVVGVATAVMGGLQSVAQYQQQQAQYQYQQQVADLQYQQQMQAYEASQRAYNEQIASNYSQASRAYQQKQLELKGEYDKAKQASLNLMTTKIKEQGEIMATGRTGKSVSILASDAEREYGRDLANLGTNLGYAEMAYRFGAEDVQSQLRSANASAAAGRMMQPINVGAGPAPSPFGAVLGVASAGLSGYQTYLELKPPKSGKD